MFREMVIHLTSLEIISIARMPLVDLFRVMENGEKEFPDASIASVGKPYRSTMGR